MRILILAWRDRAHPLAGGSEVYVGELAAHWAAAGQSVTVYAAAVPGQPAEDVVDGYRVRRAGGRLGVYAAARRRYLSEDRGRFDVILDVVNTRPFLAPSWAGDVPVVALVHQVAREVWAYETPLPVAALGRWVLEPRWLRTYATTPVLTVSASSRRSLQAYGIPDAAVVPEGIAPPDPQVAGRRPVEPRLLWVGRVSANKRPEHAIAALRLLRAGALPDAELDVVGDGPLLPRLRRKAAPGVTLHGRVSQQRKHELMASADALVVTSVREGWGLVVSEAASYGLPSVAYDVDGLRDSVSAARGILTHPSPAALAGELAVALPRWRRHPWSAPADLGVRSWAEVAEAVLAHLAAAAGRSGG